MHQTTLSDLMSGAAAVTEPEMTRFHYGITQEFDNGPAMYPGQLETLQQNMDCDRIARGMILDFAGAAKLLVPLQKCWPNVSPEMKDEVLGTLFTTQLAAQKAIRELMLGELPDAPTFPEVLEEVETIERRTEGLLDRAERMLANLHKSGHVSRR